MAPTVEFAVTDDEVEFGVETRPLRRLPDGDYGVAYGGRVHRLVTRTITEDIARANDPSIDRYSPWEINVSVEQEFSKNECPPLRTFRGSPFVKSTELPESPEPSSIDWYLEENVNRRYIALDCDEEDIEDIIDTLHSNNIEVINHGRSRRAASNDRMYDWFVRLPLESVSGLSEAQLRAILQSAFRPNDPLGSIIQGLDALGISLTTDGTTVFFRGEIASLTPELSESVKNRKSELLEFLTNNGFVESAGEPGNSDLAPEFDSENVVAIIMEKLNDAGVNGDIGGNYPQRLREKLESLDIRTGNDDYLHARDIFLQGVSELGKTLKHIYDQRSSLVEDKKSLEHQLAEARVKIELIQSSAGEDTHTESIDHSKALSEMSSEKDLLEAKLDVVQQDLEDATEIWEAEQSAREDLEDQNQRLASKVNRLGRQLESIGETAELVETILFSATPRIVYRLNSVDVLSGFSDPSAAIRKIRGLNDKSLTGGANVGGAPGWREHHVSTGDSDDGRIYFKANDDRVHLLIGKKHTQKQDIRRLRTQM
jgi:hypothetical protein